MQYIFHYAYFVADIDCICAIPNDHNILFGSICTYVLGVC